MGREEEKDKWRTGERKAVESTIKIQKKNILILYDFLCCIKHGIVRYIHCYGFLYIVPCVVLGPFSFLALAHRSADLLGPQRGERERQKMRKKEEQVGEQGTSEQEEQQAKFVKLSPGRKSPRVIPLAQRGQVHRGVPPPRPRHLTGSEGRAPRTWPSLCVGECFRLGVWPPETPFRPTWEARRGR